MQMYNNLPHWAMSYSNINEWEDRIIVIIGLRHHCGACVCMHIHKKLWERYICIHKCIHTYTHAYRHIPSGKWGSPEGLKTVLYTFLWYTLPNCVRVCVYMFNCVLRKMWKGREACMWMWEKSLSLFKICAWKHISKCSLAKLTNSQARRNTQY